MTTMAEFARTLAEEAEKRGLRIVIEPIANPIQQSISEPVKEPEIEVVAKTAAQIEKERVREEKSWITVPEAARMLNCNANSIYDKIRRNMIEWRHNERGHMVVNTAILNGSPIRTRSAHSIPVRCVETGKAYSSMKQASYAMGLPGNAVRNAILRGRKAGGYHFRKIESEK